MIGAGDFSQIPDMIMEVGSDLVNTVIKYWTGQFQSVIDASTEINDIAMHSYKGDISVEDGAKQLKNFYDNYINLTVNAN